MGSNLLSSQRAANLSGQPVRLSSEFADGRVLSITREGTPHLDYPGEAYDDQWSIVPVGKDKKDFAVVSERKQHLLCHNPRLGGEVTTYRVQQVSSKKMKDDCIWKVGDTGELYQPDPEGGERYLWLVNDDLFVTQDGHLAENWVPLQDMDLPPPVNQVLAAADTDNKWLYIVIAVIIMILVWLLLRSE